MSIADFLDTIAFFTFRTPQMLVLLALLPVLLLLWRWRGKRVGVGVLLLRLLMVTLVVLALADPMIGQETTPGETRVLLVDQSGSLTADGQTVLRQAAATYVQPAERRNPQNRQNTVMLWFGGNIVDPGAWGNSPSASQEPPQSLRDTLNPEASDLAQALRTAREMLRSTGGEVVLFSDGYQTTGDVLAEAQRAADEGIVIDVVATTPAQGPEVRVAGVYAPRSIRMGEPYDVQIVVERRDGDGSSAALTPLDGSNTVPVTLQLWESTSTDAGNERLLAEEQVELAPGFNTFAFDNEATAEGVVKLRARIQNMSADTFERNNQAMATTVVAPPPRVLLVAGNDTNAQELSAALWRAGVESDTIPAEDLPSRLSELHGYEGMVLLDVSAHNLSLDQMSSVREFVRSEGRGLVVTGGQSGFSLGGYKDTPLEPILPILLDPPPRPQRSNVALLLIVDRSASMSIPVDVSKFDMAKEAAVLSTEMLQSNDHIGILAFDTGQYWTVPFQTIGAGLTLKQIQDAIVLLNVGGGTDIYAALDEGLTNLMYQDASVRHAVILTDGRSFTNDMPAYQQLIRMVRDEDITLSAIAIGRDSDTDLLDQLAEWGGGRYYYADKPEDIPRLTLQESEIARSDPVVEGMFFAELATPHPLLNNVAIAELPALDGYIATTRRENAEVVLETSGTLPGSGDPILATWHYGLGRVVAWTPSVAAPWASDWPEWGGYGPFWAQIIRYTLPKPDSGPLQVWLEPQERGARLVVDAFESGGNPLDLATAVARITLPDGTRRETQLYQIAPGRYVQNLLLPIEGSYGIEVKLFRDDSRIEYEAEIGYAHAVPAEYTLQPTYRPSQHSNVEYPQGYPLLERIATMTGGTVRDPADLVPDAAESPDAEADNPRAAGTGFSLLTENIWPWLLAAALVVWILDIAVRRR